MAVDTLACKFLGCCLFPVIQSRSRTGSYNLNFGHPMTRLDIPIIDLTPYFEGGQNNKRKVAADMNRACEDIGFFIITGHGVDPELCRKANNVSREFFDLPVEEKLVIGQTSDEANRGYEALGTEVLSATIGKMTPPDLKESFSLGPINVPDDPYYHSGAAAPHYARNMWPERPAGFRKIIEDYVKVMEKLARDLHQLAAIAFNLPEDFFEPMLDKPFYILRALNYPNQLDQLRNKNGGGIWIHGSAQWLPVATRGCVSVNNWDFARLAPQIDIRDTPVIISEAFRLVTDKKLVPVQQYLFGFLERWRTAWESNETEAYLGHYSEDFRNDRWDYEGWTTYKREVNRANQERSIQISNVSIFEHGGIYHIRFMQHYESTGTKDLGWKELYVRREGTQLRILSEVWRKLKKNSQPLQPSPSPSFLMAYKEFGPPSM